MPGYYIRTASGIVAVRDWYVRTAAGIQKVREAYIRTAAGIQKYYPAVTGTEALNTTANAAVNTGLTTQIGYQRHTLALADFGTIGSAAVTGGFVLEQLCRQQAGTGNLFGLSATGSTFPPDADTTWQRVEATGVFADSGGLSVTRTLLRTDSGTPVNNLESGRAYRSWNFATQTMPFIAGNAYTVKVYTSP